MPDQQTSPRPPESSRPTAVSNDGADRALVPVAAVPVALLETPRSLREQFQGQGWTAYRRLAEILWSAFAFALPLWLDYLTLQEPTDVASRWQRVVRRLWRWIQGRYPDKDALIARHAVWLRERMTKLGPTFIKIGQTLATRPDLVPLAYLKELSLLQDDVPPFPNDLAWKRITEELGRPPRELFHSIDSDPLAAASLGQVYRARLKTGEDVVIKVQRPDLERIIRLDLIVLRYVASVLERRPDWIKGIEWTGIVDEFGRMIAEEIDYEKEIENAERFRQNFAEWRDTIHVPKIYPDLSTRRVITMEYVDGLKVTDLDGLRAAGRDPGDIVRLLTRTYLKQLLEDGFFHADPHPGNLRVMPDGRLAFFDFGMVGQITDGMRSGMVDAFFHIVEKDVPGLFGDAVTLGFLRPGFDPEDFKPVVQAVFNKYLGIKLGRIRFRDLTYALAETIYSYPFVIPSNFTFIVRALGTIEGIGLLVEPGFSFFDTARPYAKEFMLKRESAFLIGKLVRGEEGEISWGKVWNLAKLAYRTYFKTSPSK